MSKKDQNSNGSELDQERAQQAKEAKQKLKEASKAKPAKEKKEKKPAGAGRKKFKKFWKDFRGEIKKIVWPNGKTVLKNTLIVLATVVVIGALVWIVDFGLSRGVSGLKVLAEGQSQITTAEFFESETTTEAATGETTTAAAQPAETTTAAQE